MKVKSKHRLYVWGSVGVVSAFLIGTIVPITLNFFGKNQVSLKFDSNTSFVDDSKFSQYYDCGTSTDSKNQQVFNQFWVEHNNDKNMQLAEVAYGIKTFMQSFASNPTYYWKVTIYNYEHRVIDNEFQFAFWYEVRFNFHPKKPTTNYADAYRGLIHWTSPTLLQGDSKGVYNTHYYMLLHSTPLFNDWGDSFRDWDKLTYSLVFANQEFSNE